MAISKESVTDILDQEITVGSYVVSYNHIYKVERFERYGAYAMLVNRSKTTRHKWLQNYEMFLIPDKITDEMLAASATEYFTTLGHKIG